MTVTQYASLAKKKNRTNRRVQRSSQTYQKKKRNKLTWHHHTQNTLFWCNANIQKKNAVWKKRKKIQSNKNKHSADYWHRRFSNVNKGGQGVCQSFLYLSLSPLAFKRERGTGATNWHTQHKRGEVRNVLWKKKKKHIYTRITRTHTHTHTRTHLVARWTTKDWLRLNWWCGIQPRPISESEESERERKKGA